MRRNVSGQFVGAQMVSASDGSAFTGSVTVYVTGDAGTQAVGSVGSGACTHEGNGFHSYAPAQAETNYTHVAFTFIGSGAIPATVQIYPTAYDANGRADLGAISGTAVSTSSAQLGVNVVNAAGTAWGSGAITAASIASNAITAAKIATDAITAAKIAADAIGASELAADAATEIATAVWAAATRQLTGTQAFNLTGNITGNLSGSVGSVTAAVLTALDNLVIASGTMQAGSTSTTAVLASGLSSYANDILINAILIITGGTGAGQQRTIKDWVSSTQVATVNTWSATPDNTSTYILLGAGDYIGANLLALVASTTAATGLQTLGQAYTDDGYLAANTTLIEGSDATNQINAAVDAAFTTQMADSVPADGTIATREQAIYMILQFLTEASASGTTLTVRKVDGSTSLMTFTLDDGSNPTSITRAT